MKPVSQILIIFILFLGISNCKKNTSDIVYDKKYIEQIKATRNEMVFYLSTNEIPGASVAVMKDGKLIYSEGLGLASKDFEVAASRDTKFRIGEVSELFTSFMYLRMVEEGTLQPDSSVQFYLPDFPKKEYNITLKDLVYQMSGIRDAKHNETDWRGLNVTIQKGIEQFKNDPLQDTPGWYQTQSMFHYNLLGAIMEKATNKRFDEILKKYANDTLQLTQTLVDNPLATIKGRTDFYDYNFVAQVINATFRDMRFRAPSQGLLSNAEDLVKFGNAIINSDLLSEETKSSMFEPVPLFQDIPSTIANGWILLTDRNGKPIYGKNGKVTGGSAAMLIYPENNLIIACTTNLNTGTQEPPIFELMKHFVQDDKETEETND